MTGAEASALNQWLLLLGTAKMMATPRRFWSLFVFSPSADAFSQDDEDDGNEGVLFWWSCRPYLCVFLTFDSVVLMAFSALPLSRFSCLSFLVFPLFSPFFFCLRARSLEGLIYSLTYIYLEKIQCINSRMQISADLQ
jgi:hypothetical protein